MSQVGLILLEFEIGMAFDFSLLGHSAHRRATDSGSRRSAFSARSCWASSSATSPHRRWRRGFLRAERQPVPYPLEGDAKHSALVSPFAVDLDRFPLFAQATPARFLLKAGETIFNPAGWWHATRILSPSIAMVISTVGASNWDAYADDLARPRQGVPSPVTAALRAYLSMVGVVLSAKERLLYQDAG